MKKVNRSTILREKRRQAMKNSKVLVMFRLAYHFLKVAGIDPICSQCDGEKEIDNKICQQCDGTGKYYDANKQARGLSAVYKMAGKNEEKAKAMITEAGEYFNSKNLSWTPIAVWRNWELIREWKKENKTDVSERRRL